MTVRETPQDRPITGKTVLFGMLAFFGVIVAVNMVFVYFALDSWPGLTTSRAYEKGLAYNETLAAAERQHQIGWRSKVSISPDQLLSVKMADVNGAPLTGLFPTARLVRPTHEGVDRTVGLAHAGGGIYVARLDDIAKGRWQVVVQVPGESSPRYFLVHEIMVR